MKQLYEALVDPIPSDLKVRLACRGRWQACVETEGGCGVASLLLPGKEPYCNTQLFSDWQGRPLKDLAARAGGEDPVKSALGVAALNAWYNRRGALEELGARLYSPKEEGGHVFTELAPFCVGKIVSTIGHFHGSEELHDVKELRIFEKEPRPGDYPAEREAELLPESDVVIITGMTLTNRTAEEVLRFCRGRYAVLTGPSVPMAAVWKEYGVRGLYGTLVWDIPRCLRAARYGGHKETWPSMGKCAVSFS